MRHRIAAIPGDGIGKEVVPEGMRVLDAAGRRFGFDIEWTTFDWSCERYTETGRMMPEDGLDRLRQFEAIFLGAVGFPGVPDHVSLWGLLIPIRRGFHQYVNLRPVRLLKGVRSPLAGRGLAATAKDYPAVKTSQYHIDILTAHFVQHPDWFDVVVGSNLFGDILSDLGPAIAGSIGLAPGGNINPEKEYPSMFEPVHGSAPDIAGKGIANPIAQIWTGAMMLEHLGHAEAARAVVAAIERLAEEGKTLTRDLGGRASTTEVGRAIAALL